jgi:Tfp pilus assembly protein PilO
MLRIRPTKKSLLCLAAVAVLLLVASGFAYYNFASRLGKLNTQISKKQERLDNSEEITRRLARVEQEYTDAQVRLGTLEKGVSTKSYVPTLLRQIEDLGKSVSMRVVGVRPKVAVAAPVQAPASTDGDKGDKPKVVRKAPDPYDKLNIDIEVTGKYCDVARFLYKVTSFPKIIAVNSVQITPVTGSSSKETIGSPDLSVKLGTTAFILKEPGAKSGGKDQQTANAGSGQS